MTDGFTKNAWAACQATAQPTQFLLYQAPEKAGKSLKQAVFEVLFQWPLRASNSPEPAAFQLN